MYSRGGLAGEGNRRIGEPGGNEAGQILGARQRARDAPDVRAGGGSVSLGEVILGDDVGDSDAAAGYQHAEHLSEYRWLVGGQVDHAVGDHDIDRRVRQWQALDLALAE